MPSLDNMMLRQIIMDHYENPRNHELVNDNEYQTINMDSETCIDNIDVQAKIKNGKIEDIRFDGEACAICTASTSIMTELLIGKTIDEAREIIKNYNNMIYEKDYDPDVLEEAIAFMNTHKQANRIKCATLGWMGITKLIDESEKK
ncbi:MULTISPECIES: Fe-S cluster assembly sulfur transfer protein SufU [Coprobacillaceae]|uniref:Fe-S cluster assembly sulfur transfer protein SufU n=1 Tax=Coprobacillaceae TaxID=2810280 RepID=UPI000E48BF27|nr:MULTISPECIES: SUF system NifU family Fe-S cluster assembly protein [Coprobacillaceae]RHM59038.1 SUF system NifU family Fe-S cluster assembly protein [Coprobacillus sp. AF33-1AC]RHS91519.1 SUF system NifU family Fe-S cluster assembly protein [Erysipelatoclostridium sp. AM42-17]